MLSRRLQTAAAALTGGLVLAVLACLLAPAQLRFDLAQSGITARLAMVNVHGREGQGAGAFRWTTDHTLITWAGQAGVVPRAVVFDVNGFPGRQPDTLEIVVNGQSRRYAVPDGVAPIRVVLPRGVTLPLTFELRSMTTRPEADPRDLGVRLYGVTIENGAVSERLRSITRPLGLVLVLFGAVAWLAGAWAWPARPWLGRMIGIGAAIAVRSVAMLVAAQASAALTFAGTVLGVAVALILAWRRPRLRTAALLSGAVAALAWMAIATWSSTSFVDVPRWDIWEMAPLLEDVDARGLTWTDLWKPHNEHRPVVARALILANIWWANWYHWYELWTILAVLGAHVLLLVTWLRRATTCPAATVLGTSGIAAFVLSAAQWENLLQGWQVTLLVGTLSVCGGFMVLARQGLTWPRLGGAALWLLLSTASFGTGLVAWPIGALPIVWRREPGWKRKLVAWMTLSVAVIVAYLHGLNPPEPIGSSPVFRSWEAFGLALAGTLVALGTPAWYTPSLPIDWTAPFTWVPPRVALLALVGAALLLTPQVRRRSRDTEAVWMLPAMLVAFGLAACALMAVGRVSVLGVGSMTASRYVAVSALFWVGLVLAAVSLPVTVSRRVRGAALAGTLVASSLGFLAWPGAWPFFESHFVGSTQGRAALLREDWAGTGPLYPSPPVLDRYRQYLRKRQVSIYRPVTH